MTVNRLFHGDPLVRESSTFQLIFGEGLEKGLEKGRQEGWQEGREEGLEQGLEQGREEGLEIGRRAIRESILSLGKLLLGDPSEAVRRQLAVVADIDALQRIASRIPQFSSWDQIAASLN